MAEPSGPQF
jgi:calcium-dependent protein kinase